MKYYCGIDLGGMSATAGLADEAGHILGKVRKETDARDGVEGTADKLAALVNVLRALPHGEEVCAVGIGSPGVIDSANGTVVKWSNYGWENVPIGELVSRRISLPVFVTNDANAAALGEAKYGSGKNYRDSVLITLGTGIGGGIVLGGKLFEGYRSAGAELGHIVIKKGGVLCSCGRRGCFECYASATALIRETRRALMLHGESSMWKGLVSLEAVSGRTAFDGAKKGDAVAEKVVSEYIENLGEGIVNIVNMIRPEIVILGGGIAGEGEYLTARLKRFVEKYVYASTAYAPLEITCASLGNDAGIYGAFAYAMQKSAPSA